MIYMWLFGLLFAVAVYFYVDHRAEQRVIAQESVRAYQEALETKNAIDEADDSVGSDSGAAHEWLHDRRNSN